MINHPNRKKKAPKTTSAAAPAKPARNTPRPAPRRDHDREYDAFRMAIRKRFEDATRGQTKVFQTDASGLWQAYLDAMPLGERQVHNCTCCRHFIERFGGLVCIGENGETWPVMWDVNAVPEFYVPVVARLETIVDSARVTGVFYTRAQVWGTPQTETWNHLAVMAGASMAYLNKALSPGQASAAVRENVKTVMYSMAEYGPAVLDEAIRVLQTGTLARSEKFIDPVRWLRKLHDWPKGLANQEVRDRILLRAVAHAPRFCHIKSSVVGPLLDDITAGVSFAVIERKHRDKLHPLNYQRPQAAPSAGNVAAAEKLVQKLGIERSLERRFARLDELKRVNAIWLPRPMPEQHGGSGVFAHVRTKTPRHPQEAVPPVNTPAVPMTWEKFSRTVLSTEPAEIEILVPYSAGFFAMTTAAHADAPPILKWDQEGERNPFATYTYVRPMPASSWGLISGRYVELTGIFPHPNLWGSNPQPHLGQGVLLVIDGCKDSQKNQGNALFPDILKAELHGARATIESYSKTAKFSGHEDASVAGLTIGSANAGQTLRTRAGNGVWNYYTIDRWD